VYGNRAGTCRLFDSEQRDGCRVPGNGDDVENGKDGMSQG